jgi:hypothetical protein
VIIRHVCVQDYDKLFRQFTGKEVREQKDLPPHLKASNVTKRAYAPPGGRKGKTLVTLPDLLSTAGAQELEKAIVLPRVCCFGLEEGPS